METRALSQRLCSQLAPGNLEAAWVKAARMQWQDYDPDVVRVDGKEQDGMVGCLDRTTWQVMEKARLQKQEVVRQ